MKRATLFLLAVLLPLVVSAEPTLKLHLTGVAMEAEEPYTSFSYDGTIVINGYKYAVTLPEDGNSEALLLGPDVSETASARGYRPKRFIMFGPDLLMGNGQTYFEFYEEEVKRNPNTHLMPPGFYEGMWADSRQVRDRYDDEQPTTAMSVPTSVDPKKKYTCTLKVIGHSAFQNNEELEGVELPEGVTTIWSSAFDGCKNLKTVKLPSTLLSIGPRAFAYCPALTTISIPNAVTEIQGAAFACCTGLTSANLPSGVKEVAPLLFYNCENLQTVTGGEGVEKINLRAFDCCYKLQGFTLSSVLDSICESAFVHCHALTQMAFPRSLRGFGKKAFAACPRLKTITFEEGSAIEAIEDEAFVTTGLTTVALPATVTKIGYQSFAYSDISTLTLPTGLTELGDSAFYGTKLRSITIPDAVTTIGVGAFEDCEDLEMVTFGSGSQLQALADNVFNGTALTSFAMPDGVTTMGKDLLPYTLETVKLSANLREIPERAFQGMEDLSSVTFGQNAKLESIGYRAFCQSPLTSFAMPATVKTIGDYAFYFCKQLTNVTFSSQLTSIGEFAFYRCEKLKTLTLPGTLTTLGQSAFSNCYNLESLTLPASLKEIPNGAFQSTWGLTTLTLPEGIEKVGEGAFLGDYNVTTLSLPQTLKEVADEGFCSIGVKTLNLPKGLTVIGDKAFETETIRDVYVKWESSPAVLSEIGFSTNVYNVYATLHVPQGTKAVYEAAAGWSKFAKIAEEGETLLNNGDVFWAVSPDGVNMLYTVADAKTKTCYLGRANGARFEGDPFYEGDITVPATANGYQVASVGPGAFQSNYSLTSVTLSEGIKDIKAIAFSMCTALKCVTLPSTATSIGYDAFYNCKAIEKITAGMTTPFAFADSRFPSEVYDNATVYVPKDTKSLYQATDGWKNFKKIVEAGNVVKGDANGDGLLDITDAEVALNYILGRTNQIGNAADVNGDTRIDIADVVWIIETLTSTGQ